MAREYFATKIPGGNKIHIYDDEPCFEELVDTREKIIDDYSTTYSKLDFLSKVKLEKICVEIEHINSGIYNCALIHLHIKNIEEAIEISRTIHNSGLSYCKFNDHMLCYDDNNFKAFKSGVFEYYIYKYPHQLPIIKDIENTNNNLYIRTYLLGKLLGYSEEKIANRMTTLAICESTINE